MSNPSKFVLLKPTAGLRSTQSKAELKSSLASPPFDIGTLSLDNKSELKSDDTAPPSLRVGEERGLVARSGKGRRRGGRQSGGFSLPAPMQCTITVRHKFRFNFSSTVTDFAITSQMIGGACGGIADVVNSNVIPWASTIRVRKLVIYPSVGLSTTPVAGVKWLNTASSYIRDSEKIETMPAGVTIERPVSTSPPAGTLAKAWQTVASANQLFLITAQVGSILDFYVEFTLVNIYGPTALGVTAGVLGGVYYLALDGPGVNKIRPMGLPTTA